MKTPQSPSSISDNGKERSPEALLFAQARELRPDTSRAEFAFETRLCARLREQRVRGRSAWLRFAQPAVLGAFVLVGLGQASRAWQLVEDAEILLTGLTDALTVGGLFL